MTPEKRVQTPILRYLKRLQDEGKPVFFERRQAGGASYKMGIPDIYAVIAGKHLEIEVKAPGGKMSPMQEHWRDKFKSLGIAWICTDKLQDVIDIVERMLRND